MDGNMNDIETTIRAIKQKPYKIAKAVGFEDVQLFPHNEWMQEILSGKGDYTLMAHRGSYKSSVLSVCIALMMVVRPQENIIFLRKADNDVSEMIRMVKKALESDVLKAIAMVLYRKPLELIESSASSITTNLFVSASGSSQLLGIGLKSSITGKHASIVITDDICNITDRISKAERDRTKIQYQELQNIRNRGGRIINLGTKWHKDDVFTMMKNVHVYDCHETKLISDEELEDLKASMTRALFACNYELKIIADEDAMFTEAKFTDDAKMVYNGICHIDAAYGGEDATAFTIGAHKDGYLYVYGKKYQKHVDDCLDDILTKKAMYLGGRTYTEDNADKGYLQKELKRRGDLTRTYHESMNKYIKISTYLKGIWDKVIFISDTDPSYIEEILEYNENAVHDDCPDSLSCVARLMWRQFGREEYKSIWN
jgi:hypothetical protein